MTEKQKMFCDAYIANGFNAKQAYYTAYGKTNNKEPSYPYMLLKKEEVANYIKQRREEIYESMNIDAMRVMQAISEIAFENSDEVNISNKLKALELLSKNLSLQTQKTENKDVIEVQIMED